MVVVFGGAALPAADLPLPPVAEQMTGQFQGGGGSSATTLFAGGLPRAGGACGRGAARGAAAPALRRAAGDDGRGGAGRAPYDPFFEARGDFAARPSQHGGGCVQEYDRIPELRAPPGGGPAAAGATGAGASAAVALGGCGRAWGRRRADDWRCREDEKVAYAAVRCVGKWGEVKGILIEAQRPGEPGCGRRGGGDAAAGGGARGAAWAEGGCCSRCRSYLASQSSGGDGVCRGSAGFWVVQDNSGLSNPARKGATAQHSQRISAVGSRMWMYMLAAARGSDC